MLAKIQKRIHWVYVYPNSYTIEEIENFFRENTLIDTREKIYKQKIFSQTGKETFLVLDEKKINSLTKDGKENKVDLIKVLFENEIFWINKNYCELI